MTEKLKIGLMIDSTDVPYWVYLMIEKINQSNERDDDLFPHILF